TATLTVRAGGAAWSAAARKVASATTMHGSAIRQGCARMCPSGEIDHLVARVEPLKIGSTTTARKASVYAIKGWPSSFQTGAGRRTGVTGMPTMRQDWRKTAVSQRETRSEKRRP